MLTSLRRSAPPRLVGALLWLALGLACASALPADETAPGPLRILLTNDDGFEATGILAMREALVAAGHHVTLVAPRENQSGSSVGVDFGFEGPLDVKRHAPGVWSVGGRPADAVLVGLRAVLADDPPDLVVSGANLGQNIGQIANSSGTVGAAIMAIQQGVPAIAISVGIRLDEVSTKPRPFPSTFAAFPAAADFGVRLIRELERRTPEGAPLLPPRTALNVNYPALPRDRVQGVKVTRLGQTASVTPHYEDLGDGRYAVRLEAGSSQEPVEPADTTYFRRGYITITPLDGNWTASGWTIPAFVELVPFGSQAAGEASRVPAP